MAIQMESNQLVRLCIEAATESATAVESWRRQRRTLERLPSHLADSLLHQLLHRRLLFPSLLEVFKNCVEEIDFRGESIVDAEWIAYLGAFHYLHSLNLSDCHKINNSAIWPISGMIHLKEINLSRCTKISDDGIKHLLSISILEKLSISETSVTSQGIILLASLKNLSLLDLGGLPVTDSALNSLQVLKKLSHLDIWGSEVSNKGIEILNKFPELTFLNIAWTRVTNLPNLPSLKYLNMSNCTIQSLSNLKAALSKLILTGSTISNSSNSLLNINTNYLLHLDLSNSSFNSLDTIPYMKSITHLNLSNTSIKDDSLDLISSIGASLKYLNLSNTKITSTSLEILAGHVQNLETLLLSNTVIDDTVMYYISMMSSLKEINLSGTNIKGLIPSFTLLTNLKYLETLNLEETRINETALTCLSSFNKLANLYLQSGSLTDTSLHEMGSIQCLINLGIREGVLTNTGLEMFNPPMSLRLLDLRGCWLLTQDVLLSFSVKHPQVVLRHELVIETSRTFKKRDVKSVINNKDSFIDQRLKYSKEELLSLQFSNALFNRNSDEDIMIPELC